jgi:RimJ/RimL family protein N-acetyltransferase
VRWINKVINDSSVMFLIAEYKGIPSGTVRFDFMKDFKEAEVGIYLAPNMHGKGLGARMLCAAEQFAVNEHRVLEKIIAKVLMVNIASERMFNKAEYTIASSTENYIQLEKTLRN